MLASIIIQIQRKSFVLIETNKKQSSKDIGMTLEQTGLIGKLCLILQECYLYLPKQIIFPA